MKKVLSVILTVMMIVCMIPVTVLPVSAEGEEKEVTYVDRYWDADAKKVVEETKTVKAKPIDSNTTTLAGGWYYVSGDVSNSDSRIEVTGTPENPTRIILTDGYKVQANRGILVSENCALVIYGQAEGTGTLNAYASGSSAAIGGGYNDAGGKITINGGTINTKATMYGAGIGGGNNGAGGKITINGGTVEAEGGQYAAGIGGGQKGAGGTVTINGGTVNATGGKYGAGIGSGYHGTGGEVTINGGTVEAEGGTDSAGIGGGKSGAGGTVTISGGTVNATGGKYGAGIGGGRSSEGGTVKISGGTVTATGKDKGAGIGAGADGAPHGSLVVDCDVIVIKAGSSAPGDEVELEAYRNSRSTYVYLHTHAYDCSIASDEYLKSGATYAHGTVYYKSCACGACDKSENAATFVSGDPLSLSDCFILQAVEYGLRVGRQGKLGEDNSISTEAGRTIIPLTAEQLGEIGDCLTILANDGNGDFTLTVDCVYTYFYDVTDGEETKYEAGQGDLADFAAFIILDKKSNDSPLTGYGYFRVYNGDMADEDYFMFDALYPAADVQ